jgi:hypothetical protein
MATVGVAGEGGGAGRRTSISQRLDRQQSFHQTLDNDDAQNESSSDTSDSFDEGDASNPSSGYWSRFGPPVAGEQAYLEQCVAGETTPLTGYLDAMHDAMCSLKNLHMGPHCALALSAALAANPHVVVLDLEGTYLADAGAAAILEALGRNRVVQSVSMARAGLTDGVSEALCDMLAARRSSLVELDVSGNRLGARWARSVAAVVGQAGGLPKLVRFNASGNDIRAAEGRVLCAALALPTSAAAALRVLDLSWNPLRGAVATLAESVAVPGGGMGGLAELHLASCGIDDAGVVALAQATARPDSTIEVLDLRHNRFTGGAAVPAFEAALTGVEWGGPNNRLRVLRLGHNTLGLEGVRSLMAVVLSSRNAGVEYLGLANTFVLEGEEDMEALLEVSHAGQLARVWEVGGCGKRVDIVLEFPVRPARRWEPKYCGNDAMRDQRRSWRVVGDDLTGGLVRAHEGLRAALGRVVEGKERAVENEALALQLLVDDELVKEMERDRDTCWSLNDREDGLASFFGGRRYEADSKSLFDSLQGVYDEALAADRRGGRLACLAYSCQRRMSGESGAPGSSAGGGGGWGDGGGSIHGDVLRPYYALLVARFHILCAASIEVGEPLRASGRRVKAFFDDSGLAIPMHLAKAQGGDESDEGEKKGGELRDLVSSAKETYIDPLSDDKYYRKPSSASSVSKRGSESEVRKQSKGWSILAPKADAPKAEEAEEATVCRSEFIECVASAVLCSTAWGRANMGRVGEEEENAYLVPPDDDERQWREDFEQNVWPRVLAARDEKAVGEELCFRHKTLYTSEATLQCLEAHTSLLRAIFVAARRSPADSRRGGAGRSHADRAEGMSLETWTDLLQRSEVVAGPAASAPGSDRREEGGGGKESAGDHRDSKSDGKESEENRSQRRSVVLHSAEGEFTRRHSKVNLNAHVCDSFAAAKTPGDSKWKRALAKSAGARARVLFSVTDARRWFVFSLMLRSADVGATEKTAKKATTMSFLDFSEALCRVAHARPGPDEEELRDLIGELHEGVGDGTS